MSDEPLPNSEFILYQTEDGRTRVQGRFEDEALWLTQAQIAELFETTPQNVTLHLKGIFAESELDEAATCKDYLQVRFARRMTPMSKNKPTPGGRPKMNTEVSLARSSGAEYRHFHRLLRDGIFKFQTNSPN